MSGADYRTQFMQAFNGRYLRDTEAMRLAQLAYSGGASVADAQKLADIIAAHATAAFRELVTPELLQNPELFRQVVTQAIGPAMFKLQDMISGVAQQVVDAINLEAGLGLKALPAKPTDRIENMVKKMLGYENPEDAFWMLDRPVENIIKSEIDRTLQENAEYAERAGARPYIYRETNGGCNFCDKRQYRGPLSDAPAGVWQRHEDCRCRIEYTNAMGQTDVVHNYWRADRKHKKRK